MPLAVRHQFWIVLACLIVFFFNLGATHLWDEDETLYASIAREMLQRGDWVVPTFNGKLFPEKPPLMFWTILAGFEVWGYTEFAARCGAALFGLGTALLAYHLGRILFNARVGLWAGLCMASTIIFTVSARAATVDAALAFFTTLAILVVARALAQQFAPGNTKTDAAEPGRASPGQGFHLSWLEYVGIYAALAITVLGKGPVGFLLPAAAIGLFLLIVNVPAPAEPSATTWYRRVLMCLRPLAPGHVLRTAWEMRPFTALALILLIAGPWYTMVGIRTQGEWLAGFFARFNLRPFLQPILGHHGPIFYYIPAVLIGLFPWSVFLIGALAAQYRRIRAGDRWRPGDVLTACWIGVFFVFWSICSTKLPHYLVPAYPALALIIGAWADRWLEAEGREPSAWRGTVITLVVVGLGIAVAMPLVAAYLLPGESLIGLVGLVLLAGAAGVAWFARRRQPGAALAAFAVMAVLFLAAAFGLAAVRVDRHQNAPYLVAAIAADSPDQPRLAAFRFFRQSMVFYAQQPVLHCDDPQGLKEFLAGPGPAYVFTTDRHQEQLEREYPGQFSVLARQQRFLHRGELLVLAHRGGCSAAVSARRISDNR